MQTILVTGGAGFIGSHTCLVLLENNFRVVVIDSFVNGSYKVFDRVRKILEDKISNINDKLLIYEGDIRDEIILNKLFEDCLRKNTPIYAVIHFAGLKAVSDSFKYPNKYWDVNVNGSQKLFSAMEKYNCKNIVFSSSATVYDHSNVGLMNEKTFVKPANPYGETKIEVEKILKKIALEKLNTWNIIMLRYFNPIGAHSSGLIGEDPKNNPTNLFPLLVESASSPLRTLEIYGNDWPTSDGTCIRDFIHVMDLADAHLASLFYFENRNLNYLILNVGTGKGTSVLELIKIFEEANNCKIPYKFVKRREGDASQSIADNSLILRTLDWINKRDIKDMCIDGWAWKLKNPNGYIDR